MENHSSAYLHRLHILAACLLAGSTAMIGDARAQGVFPPGPAIPTTTPVPAQFDITGFIQEATVDPSMCPTVTEPRLKGGTVMVNGKRIVIPCNTFLQMPAFALTWADLMTQAPKSITPSGTGLALKDPVATGAAGLLNSSPASYSAALPSTEIRLVGNIVKGQYIAGLVFISQQALNTGQGIISCIDYDKAELQVGGTPQPPGAACPNPVPAGVARVRMNDPIGRFGKSHGAPGSGADVIEPGFDPRFTADTDNPTMHALTGFPVCIPRKNPFTEGTDPLCPQSNRPVAPNCRSFDPATGIPSFPVQSSGYCTTFVMDPPGAPLPAGVTACPGPGCPTDPTRQAPLQVGDMITYSGTLKADAAGAYVSAHTIAANLGIYTEPKTKPAYVYVEEVLAGTGGDPVAGLTQEATGRMRMVGFTTDPTTLVDIYAVDQDPLTGALSDRLLATLTPTGNAILGRFRTPANNRGAFLPPTRNYRAVSRTACAENGFIAPCVLAGPDANGTPFIAANGLVTGQFTLPNFEFIFPENTTLGQALVPNNLQDLPFLYCGWGPIDGPGSGSAVVGQLDPPPWDLPMSDPIFRATLCPYAKPVGAP
jgi:hypothetical protein